MDSIGSILKKYDPLPDPPAGELKPARKGNPFYGQALDLSKKLNLPITMCFKLLKKYTPIQLDHLSTWWIDYPRKNPNPWKNIGLLIWKLKQMYPKII